MSKMVEGIVKYTIGEDFDGSGDEITGSFTYPVIDDVQDAIDTLGESDTKKLLQKAIKIQYANSARIKLQVANGHIVSRELSEETKAKLKATRVKQQVAIAKLKELSPEQLAELGITL